MAVAVDLIAVPQTQGCVLDEFPLSGKRLCVYCRRVTNAFQNSNRGIPLPGRAKLNLNSVKGFRAAGLFVVMVLGADAVAS